MGVYEKNATGFGSVISLIYRLYLIKDLYICSTYKEVSYLW